MLTNPDLLRLEPVPRLLERLKEEVAASFVPGKPVRVSRAPGRLDVMGGIADYTGSLVCEMPLDRAAAVALQARDDRRVQVFSFNLLDDNRPFTLVVPLDALTKPIEMLRGDLNDRGRRWASYLVGCLAILHDEKIIDLTNPDIKGVNLALYSSVPLGAGVSSSAAIEVATMINLIDHYLPFLNGQGDDITAMRIAAMCQRVENQIAGAPCGIMDQAASACGEAGALMRLHCQPHTLVGPLFLPAGVRTIGINSGVKHSVGHGGYGKTRVRRVHGP
ncbi:MAG: galactokinase family protein [Tepidisphaeraceae bacterium]